jgi:hypothetical protein
MLFGLHPVTLLLSVCCCMLPTTAPTVAIAQYAVLLLDVHCRLNISLCSSQHQQQVDKAAALEQKNNSFRRAA